jgi:hypothetical protein
MFIKTEQKWPSPSVITAEKVIESLIGALLGSAYIHPLHIEQ